MPNSSKRRRLALASASVVSAVLLLLAFYSVPKHLHSPMEFQRTRSASSNPNRKLLQHAAEPQRIGDACSPSDVVVYQGATSPLPNGIPTYTVEVLNVCARGCAVSRVHLSCGWFSSARMINPRVFRRVRHDDCLLNDGQPLPFGSSLSFQYANTFPYPLHVSSLSCL
ncbi:hypothetical protein QJS04_geneDACA015407 [Acorus gramineus]|uniref:Protein TAPETUM DETERMINANT 1 n=1 Tax=Acorus gramineus TaxID=55184 RepID=A0AAV9A701_ACOGR|nr:hypothetical protein QJS04_geneDACA015407 [Acorus gramineus]